jgi:hypothetical protein
MSPPNVSVLLDHANALRPQCDGLVNRVLRSVEQFLRLFAELRDHSDAPSSQAGAQRSLSHQRPYPLMPVMALLYHVLIRQRD